MQRLDAEIVRDSILAASGALNTEMFGPPVFPKLQAEMLHTMNKGIWEREEDGPKVWRRSVYVYRKRGLPFPMFEVFDLPDQNITCSRRNVSTVPTQALTLLNDDFVLQQAQLFAEPRERSGAQRIRAAQIEWPMRSRSAGQPDREEQRLALRLLEEAEAGGFHARPAESERISVHEVAMKNFWSRRDFLFQAGGGLSGLALAWLLDQQTHARVIGGACAGARLRARRHSPPKSRTSQPRAKSVISLFMSGGVEPRRYVRSQARAAAIRRSSRSQAKAKSSCGRAIPDR